MEELKRKERGGRGGEKKHTCMYVHARAQPRDALNGPRLLGFIMVNCRSEGADLGYKSLIWAQVTAMGRN